MHPGSLFRVGSYISCICSKGDSPSSGSMQSQLRWQRMMLCTAHDCAIVSANFVFDLSFISDKYRCVLAVGVTSCMSFNSIRRYRRVQYHQFLVSEVLHVRHAYSVMVKSAAARIQKDPTLWNPCDELMLASNSDHLNGVIVSIELLNL